MNYIIYDLEFNQKDNTSVENELFQSKNIPFEIIQIGAIKLNESFETVSSFNTLIKPTIYKTIHPFVEGLTKITDDQVSSCNNFPTVYEDFLNFIGSDESILCVWGIVDIKELIRNINFFNLSSSKITNYIDVQTYASKYLNIGKNSKIGLKNAIELLNIPINGNFHDAYNDAYYTAEIFKIIYDAKISPSKYIPKYSRRTVQAKEKVDIASLIIQFEKMYNRNMTEEEKSIIKLAYFMGKTGQFIR
ncbi:3'-5' exonuclease [Clostridium sp. C2-6-12]|uniref:3'-5' exonuclease n=1 Tax=Clostridium sp. C2-6-12 TaxID=2698832 RepID=UPI001369D959|nr:3'-5' exonuclease [Clostridium sp. C2-6-12]